MKRSGPLLQGPTGLADLLLAYADGGGTGLATAASFLGYRSEEEDSSSYGTDGIASRGSQVESVESEPSELEVDPQWAPIPFWRLEEFEELEPLPVPDEPSGRAIRSDSLENIPGSSPKPEPIVSDACLVPALRSQLHSEAPSRRPDLQAIARSWSKGQSLEHIPFLPRAAWASRVTVVVDKSERLIPFRSDQIHLVHLLHRFLGRRNVREVRYHEGFPRPWRHRRQHFRQFPSRPGEPVLVLGDLGFYGDERSQAPWAVLGKTLRRQHSAAVALLLCPADRWNPDVSRHWQAIDWSTGKLQSRQGQKPSRAKLIARAERVLGLLGFAVRIEPGLLRAVRRLLPSVAADLGTEADAWNHPQVSSQFSLYAEPGSQDFRERLQERFAKEPKSLKKKATQALRAWRAGAPNEIWAVEVLSLEGALQLLQSGVHQEEARSAHKLLRDLLATTKTDAEVPPQLRLAVINFLRRRHDSQPQNLIREPGVRQLYQRVREVIQQGEGPAPFPIGVGPDVLPPINQPARSWRVLQFGRNLRFLSRRSGLGSPLVELDSSNGVFSLEAGPARFVPQRTLENTSALPLPSSPTLTLRTDRTVATLRRIHQPDWANAMGRDRFGLWASFEVAGVSQKMRWIPPGRFYMGSPEDEPGRWEDEGPRHLETVDVGFWLADTACTQALWEAVMGNNPSRFISEQRPVEQVSWEEVASFIEDLNHRLPGLEARFPREIEWEYACRAGTEEATYEGAMEIKGENDAPVLDAIAWYGGNSGKGFELPNGVDSSDWKEKQYPHTRAGTHPVAKKIPNPWGLYDMLGNVWEWCEDRWRKNYDAQVGTEGTHRVVRGGSWDNVARNVRAACRTHWDPSYRFNLLGFRLARGQGALRQEAERAGAEPRSAQRPGAGGAGLRSNKEEASSPRPKGEAT